MKVICKVFGPSSDLRIFKEKVLVVVNLLLLVHHLTCTWW